MDRETGSASDLRHSLTAATRGVDKQQAAFRRAIDFAVNGDVRFLSHRDMLRMFGRAAVRAGLPICYSRGFNPHPKLQLPLPRPVAIASDVERLVLVLSEPLTPEETRDRLSAQMPEGVLLTSCQELILGQECMPLSATYRVELAITDRLLLDERAASLLDPSPILYKRLNLKTGSVREMDLRPLIQSIRIGDNFIEMELLITGAGSAKPKEILAALNLDAAQINHRVRRTEITWR